MAWEKELKRLRESRELLKTQSEIHRQLIQLEMESVSASLAWTRRVSRAAGSLGVAGWAAAGVAGLAGVWLVRRRLPGVRQILEGAAVWRTVQPLVGRLFSLLRSERPPAGPADDPTLR